MNKIEVPVAPWQQEQAAREVARLNTPMVPRDPTLVDKTYDKYLGAKATVKEKLTLRNAVLATLIGATVIVGANHMHNDDKKAEKIDQQEQLSPENQNRIAAAQKGLDGMAADGYSVQVSTGNETSTTTSGAETPDTITLPRVEAGDNPWTIAEQAQTDGLIPGNTDIRPYVDAIQTQADSDHDGVQPGEQYHIPRNPS